MKREKALFTKFKKNRLKMLLFRQLPWAALVGILYLKPGPNGMVFAKDTNTYETRARPVLLR